MTKTAFLICRCMGHGSKVLQGCRLCNYEGGWLIDLKAIAMARGVA